VERKEAVVIGDQMFTDILGANRCGISSILVHYIKLPEEKKIGKKRYIEKLLLF
jgi:predicted HAD superfamily phosphohydrolase YqeG